MLSRYIAQANPLVPCRFISMSKMKITVRAREARRARKQARLDKKKKVSRLERKYLGLVKKVYIPFDTRPVPECYRLGITSEQMETANPDVKAALSLHNASRPEIRNFRT